MGLVGCTLMYVGHAYVRLGRVCFGLWFGYDVEREEGRTKNGRASTSTSLMLASVHSIL